jgi:uncharacterized protein
MTEDIYAQEQRAWDLMQAGQYAESARLFEPLAALGSGCALNNLGWMYSKGHLGPPDAQRAKSLYEKAAANGSEVAKENLLASARYDEEQRAWNLMDDGKYAESARFFEALAEAGSGFALLNLGWMHARGYLGPPDLDHAIDLFERAATAGATDVHRFLGWALKKKGNVQRARAVYLEGAELGSTKCMWRLGQMLVCGESSEEDHDAGVAWLTKAAEAEAMSLKGSRFGRFRWKLTAFILRTTSRLLRDPQTGSS